MRNHYVFTQPSLKKALEMVQKEISIIALAINMESLRNHSRFEKLSTKKHIKVMEYLNLIVERLSHVNHQFHVLGTTRLAVTEAMLFNGIDMSLCLDIVDGELITSPQLPDSK